MLIAELLVHKPAEPRAFLVAFLEKLRAAGAQPLLTQPDLEAMFGMFDVTNTGTVTTSAWGCAQAGACVCMACRQCTAAGGLLSLQL